MLDSLYLTSVRLQLFYLLIILWAIWAISPYNGKNNPHYFWIRKDLPQKLSPQNSFDVFFFLTFFCVVVTNGERFVCGSGHNPVQN